MSEDPITSSHPEVSRWLGLRAETPPEFDSNYQISRVGRRGCEHVVESWSGVRGNLIVIVRDDDRDPDERYRVVRAFRSAFHPDQVSVSVDLDRASEEDVIKYLIKERCTEAT